MFWTVPPSIIRSFSLYTQQWYMSYRFVDIYHCCVYSEKLLMMDRGNCPKHVEFHSDNKFEKLVHLVGFIIRNITAFPSIHSCFEQEQMLLLTSCLQTCMTYTIAVCTVKNS